ncbi:GNAT family N-acetyltransferase [Haladaptatus caseinilyticus]|uniref:GNAT family N-acetyltransferase n=1 Tax=Haladaptatus caseinilyticus TaxID=2993314 RepID=UPI00224AD63B|nr:GNAT family N-acetyltransferase [Haladaptatus caseinilyticus]
MDVTTRHADAEDGTALLDLWHGFTDHLSEYDDRYRHKENADERWLTYFENQLVDSKYGTVVVAESDGELVGVVEARIMGNHPIFRLEDHGYVNGLYVIEPYRNEGVARSMLEAAVEWFRASPRHVNFYRINAIEGDETAQETYEALGFTPVEHVYEKQLE